MKNSVDLFLFVLILVVLPCCTWAASYSGGSGTAEDPYQIATAQDLITLGQTPSDYSYGKCFILTADIDLEGRVFNAAIIASSTEFRGSFNGKWHIISRWSINGGSRDYLGLFGKIGSSGQVRNLSLQQYSINTYSGSNYVGGVCGYNYRGSIDACYASGPVAGESYVGGLCGYNDEGKISGCYAIGDVKGSRDCVGGLCGESNGTIKLCFATGTVTGYSSVGGLCGLNNYGTIGQCYASGAVIGEQYVGGLSGMTYGTITQCYSTCSVTGRSYTGGLCGRNRGTVNRCYSTGVVTGSLSVGGLCGENPSGTITGSFWNIETTGQTLSAGGSGKTTQEMQDINTYLGAGWDFSYADGEPADWIMPNTSYPILVWQITNLYSGGSGTAEDPYKIASKADLLALASQPLDYSKSFILLNDIDLGGEVFTTAIIARTLDSSGSGILDTKFSGVFDGGDHRILNMNINDKNHNDLGLFGQIGSGGQVRRIGIVDCIVFGQLYIGGLCGINDQGAISECYAIGTVSGSEYVGGLCGKNRGTIQKSNVTGTINGGSDVGGLCGRCEYGTINRCHAAATVMGSWNNIGGLWGSNTYGTFTECYATGSVTGRYYVGGLCGQNSQGMIRQCYATGEVTSSYDSVGGLCGYNWCGTITFCYTTSSVSGSDSSQYVGGACGHNQSGNITFSYASGLVKGGTNVYTGGFCGYNNNSVINTCLWDTQVSEQNKGVGYGSSSGVTGKTTAEMKTLSTFTSAAWDFVGEFTNGTTDIWRMCANDVDYPRLSWEFSQGGDFDCPNGVALDDLLYLASHWLGTTPDTYGSADANHDGKVDLLDLSILAEQWLKEE